MITKFIIKWTHKAELHSQAPNSSLFFPFLFSFFFPEALKYEIHTTLDKLDNEEDDDDFAPLLGIKKRHVIMMHQMLKHQRSKSYQRRLTNRQIYSFYLEAA